MSDDYIVNTNEIFTDIIEPCPDEVINLWGNFPDELDFIWLASTGEQSSLDTFTVTETGIYTLIVENEFGCTRSNLIEVEYQPAPPDTLIPYLVFSGATDDTITICSGIPLGVEVFDEITGELISYPYDFDWNIANSGNIVGDSAAVYNVTGSGWYTISVELELTDSQCFEDELHYTSDSVFVVVNPVPPVFVELTGPDFVCAGDTFMLYVESNMDFITFNFNIIQDFGDSLLVNLTNVNLSATVMDINEFGCVGSAESNIFVSQVPQPEIFSNPPNAVVCPGDSVMLTTSSPGTVLWQGPSGLAGVGSNVYVSEAGLYFAEVVFYEGCALVSNTLQVAEYATPFIGASNGVLCPGDTVALEVMSTSIENIQWFDPLSGNDVIQYVSEPGTYTVSVTGCGITSVVSFVLVLVEPQVSISQPDPSVVCTGDSILIVASPGFDVYEWSPSGSGQETYFYSSGGVQVQATDTNGCTAISNTLQLNFEPLPPPPAFVFDLECIGSRQVVSISQPFGINWLDGPDGNVVSNSTTVVIDPFVNDTTLYAYLNSQFCEGPVNSLSISPKPYPELPIIATNAPVCTGTQIELLVLNSEPGVVYQWITASGVTRLGAEVSHFVQDESDEGTYYCSANLDGCITDTVAIDVDLFITRQVVLPPDTVICTGVPYVVRPDTVFSTYLWQDGSTDSLFVPEQPGEIFLFTTDENGCESFAFSGYDHVDCEIVIPNIFTPNGDGRNDFWFVSTGLARFFRAVVYNRWGRVVYDSVDIGQAWDGTHYKSGEDCSEGVYYYIVDIQNFAFNTYQLSGNLTLIRE
jgi:gliding motility-associated-like protein